MAIPVGIDFGTCFSAVSFPHGDAVKALRNSGEEKDYCPSVFYFDQKSKARAGTAADQLGERKPDCRVKYVKKKLAAPFFSLDGTMFTPGEIVKEIFQYLLEGADSSLRSEFHDKGEELFLVITVPVKFQEPELRLIRDAASRVELASGRRIIIGGLLSEPAAAALEYFGFRRETEKNILVYDLGGGTFDAAVVRETGDLETPYEVAAQAAKPIGGNDWDEKVLELIREKTGDRMRSDGIKEEEILRFFSQRKELLLRKATEIKECLSEAMTVEDDLEYRGRDYEFTVTRQEFESRTEQLARTTIDLAKHLRRTCGEAEISQVILVGGSTRMPHIREAVENAFPDCRINLMKPEMAVSYGGARYAQMLLKHREQEALKRELRQPCRKPDPPVPSPVILKSAHTYGIGYKDEQGKRWIYNLIYKDEALPITEKRESAADGANSWSNFTVFESECERGEERAEVDRGYEIMNVRIVRGQPLPDGARSVQTLTLTCDNVLELSVTDCVSGQVYTRKLKLSERIQ